jgi:hypothetical protein
MSTELRVVHTYRMRRKVGGTSFYEYRITSTSFYRYVPQYEYSRKEWGTSYFAPHSVPMYYYIPHSMRYVPHTETVQSLLMRSLWVHNYELIEWGTSFFAPHSVLIRCAENTYVGDSSQLRGRMQGVLFPHRKRTHASSFPRGRMVGKEDALHVSKESLRGKL